MFLFARSLCIFALLLAVATAAIQAQFTPAPRQDYVTLHPDTLSPNDDFGSAITIAGEHGDLVLVGAQDANNSTGAVYVFQVDALAGTSNFLAIFYPSSSAVGSNFGCAFAARGSTVFIGAQYDRNNNGSVFVYNVHMDGNGVFRAKLLQTLEQPNVATWGDIHRFFGGAIAFGNDTLVVGAASGNTSGAVFVYKEQNATWKLTATLKNTHSLGSNFGQSVAISSNGWIAVGANHAHKLRGAAVVYPPGWQTHFDAHVPSAPTGSYLGSAVAFFPGCSSSAQSQFCDKAPYLLASAPWQTSGGVVEVFSLSAGTRKAELQCDVKPPGGSSGVTFGFTLAAISGSEEMFLVGASTTSSGGTVYAYTWGRSEIAMTKCPSVYTEFNNANGNSFGSALAFSAKSHTLAIGSFSSFNNTGAAFAYPFMP